MQNEKLNTDPPNSTNKCYNAEMSDDKFDTRDKHAWWFRKPRFRKNRRG